MKNTYKVGMISLGCPKNQVDGELLLEKLSENGFQIVQRIEDSDLMIVNTCGFIEDAKREAIETILEVAQYKAAGVISAIVVTGCLAERYQDQVMEEIPEVDAVIGIGANADIVKVCQKALCGVQTNFFPCKELLPLEGERMLSTPAHWAYLKISDGCSNCCSYCAIPGIRGPFRSRPMESVVAEAESLAGRGIKELILIAQDTTLYGKDLYGKYCLAELLRRLVQIDGIRWIRLYYCYPDRITDELIDVMATSKKICKHLHLPVQSGSTEILKKMNRHYTKESYLELVEKLRAKVPDISLTTDIIVGFPGETEEDFEETLDVVRKVRYDSAFTFIYSKRTGTPAAKMENQVPADVVKKRFDRLLHEVQSIAAEVCAVHEGTTQEVLIESVSDHDSTMVTGRMSNNLLVHLKGEASMIGSYVNAHLTECKGFYYLGELAE